MHAGMPTGLASLVIQVQAFFTIGLVAVLTHERAKPVQLVGATIAGAGLVLVAFHLPPSTRVGFLLVVTAAASWAIANVIVKRIHSEQPLAVVVWASAAASIMMLPVALVLEGPATMWAAVVRWMRRVARSCVSGVADNAARVRHLGVAAAQASRSADRAVHAAGTDRCNESCSVAAWRRNHVVEANGHRIGAEWPCPERHRVACPPRRRGYTARVGAASWYAATASTMSFRADSGPSHPMTLTHLPGSRSL